MAGIEFLNGCHRNRFAPGMTELSDMAAQQKKLPNGKIVFSINRNETEYLYKEIFKDEAYIFPGAAELREKPVVFDVGANIGIFALFAAERWPGARIASFEPVPDVFRVLEQNTTGLPGVTAHNLALGAARETREITYYPRYTMMSGFDANPATDQATVAQYVRNVTNQIPEEEVREAILEDMDEMLAPRFEQRIVPVRMERMTDVVADLGVDRIDLLKIDVEGSELQVLRGMDEAVWAMVGSAVVEIAHEKDELDVAEALFRAQGMRTEIQQLPEYHGTNLHVLFAER